MLLVHLEDSTDPLSHAVGISTPTAFIIADHVLTNAQLAGELSLRQPCLQTGAGQQISDPILLHLLPKVGAFDGDEFIVRFVRKNGQFVFHHGDNITAQRAIRKSCG